MSSPAPLTVWIRSYCHCPSSCLEVTQVRACLAKARIKVCDHSGHDSSPPGIVLLDKVTAELVHLVGSLSHYGAARLLLITADRMSLSNGDVWALLQAGASDLVVWSEEVDPAAAIRARLQRWREVDELVAS